MLVESPKPDEAAKYIEIAQTGKLLPEEMALVKAAREKLRLSLSAAAEAWGIPFPTLRNWEHDKRTPTGLALTAINQLLDGILGSPSAKKPPGKKR